jgi:hypothetical protein
LKDRLLLGIGRAMIPLPRALWQRAMASGARRAGSRTGFMTDDHHRVRDFAVSALPGRGAPLAPEAIAEALELPVARVVSLLDDLERHLTFLFRNEDGAVTWAYPVTVDETPHHVSFSTGEEAWSP